MNRRSRTIAPDLDEGKIDMHLTARPTMYRGVLMRSRNEAHLAEHFDRAGWLWEYEPRCFADETGQYLPDFYVVVLGNDGEPHAAYVEAKGYPTDLDAVQRQMEIIRSSEPDAILLVWPSYDVVRVSLTAGEWIRGAAA